MKYTNWRFMTSGCLDAYTNMAVDEAIMVACQNGKVPPTLRLYGWNPPSVSVGYFQKLETAVDLEACRSLGIDVVRRLTGGRAVLHEHEVTYSVVIGEDYPDMPKSVVDSYRFICRGIVEGLKLLGADTSMESGKNKALPLNSSACFDAASMYEILYRGKKIVGSAQVRKNGVILQHGSILMDIDIKKNIRVLNKVEEFKIKLETILANKVSTLKQILGGDISRTDIEKAIYQGFEQVFKIKGMRGELSEEETELTQNCLVGKYRAEEWLKLK